MSKMDKEFSTVNEALHWASLFLRTYDREEKVAEILLMHHTGMEKSKLLASLREQLDEPAKTAFIEDVEKHAETAVPVQHLTGKEEFYGRTFMVNPDVLIPRQETEELVYGIVQEVNKMKCNDVPKLVDLGTGSGIIAISLKLELPEWKVFASDISPDALMVAQANARSLGAEIEFAQGNFLEPFIMQEEKMDIIVSNPPYIAESERSSLSPTVKDFDPSLALFAKEEGLAAYRTILEQAQRVAKKGTLLALEIGNRQGEQIPMLIQEYFPSAVVEVRQDINGRDRMIFAYLNKRLR